MSLAPSVTLSNGLNFPVVGLGTYKAENSEDLFNAVKAAINSGYRHFDCAHIYFNEQHIGKAIREAIAESNGALKREDFFIVSKCWNTFHSKPKVTECLNQILERLQLEYLDLYLMHWPMGFVEDEGDYPLDSNGKLKPSDVHFIDTYQAMEELVSQGRAKSIGVSNFNIEQLKELLAVAKIKPVCNQFEINPLFQNSELVDYCLSENIIPVAYAPLGAPDRSWLKSTDPVPLEHPSILRLAAKYNKTPAQIILKWLLSRNIVVIPKSVNAGRIAQNIDLFNFELTEEDLSVFRNEFKEQFRFYKFEASDQHKLYPFKN